MLLKIEGEVMIACAGEKRPTEFTSKAGSGHVGHRGIAEFLLAQGGRIDIFAAAMLGFTNVVKAFVDAQPGIQRTLGPHGIPLLAHAGAGGKQVADTAEYCRASAMRVRG